MADNENSHDQTEDEMRLCPICRMKVSVWATKCHYCGEEMGRPRKEELKLTLKDLGGGQATTYAPSGNVTSALESFRVEEVSTSEEMSAKYRKRSLMDKILGRKLPPPQAKSAAPDMPELDEYSKNLTASLLDDGPGSSSMSISRSQIPMQTGPTLRERGLQLGLVLVGLVILYFGGSFAWAKISDYLESQNQVEEFVYNNRALDMLTRGEEAIVAFEEAMTALRYNDTPENRDIANQVRELVLTEVDNLMGRSPYDKRDQDKAYDIIQRAVNVDSNPETQAKYESVNQEIAKFRFILKSVDAEAGTATFRLNNPNYDEKEVTLEVADRLMDRFIIQKIASREVELNDDPTNRKLQIAPNSGVESRY